LLLTLQLLLHLSSKLSSTPLLLLLLLLLELLLSLHLSSMPHTFLCLCYHCLHPNHFSCISQQLELAQHSLSMRCRHVPNLGRRQIAKVTRQLLTGKRFKPRQTPSTPLQLLPAHLASCSAAAQAQQI
jgi:hypothetical protein